MIVRKAKGENEIKNFQKIAWYSFNCSNDYENVSFPKLSTPFDQVLLAFTKKGDKEVLGGGMINLPMNIKFGNFKFINDVWGVHCVASSPCVRNLGYVRKMFEHTFQEMKEKKVVASILYPFKTSYYEKFGYGTVEKRNFFFLKTSNIKRRKTSYHVEEIFEITDELKSMYESITEKYDYISLLSKSRWEKMESRKLFKYVCYDENNVAKGVMMVQLKRVCEDENMEGLLAGFCSLDDIKNVIGISRFIYVDKTAKQEMINFVWTHRDQNKFSMLIFNGDESLQDYVHEKDFPQLLKIEDPFSMMRIIDMKKVMERVDFSHVEKFSLVFKLLDKGIKENNGIWRIMKDEKIKCVKLEGGKGNEVFNGVDFEINIVNFTQLLSGYRGIRSMEGEGITIINEKSVGTIEKVFKLRKNYLYDTF